MTLWRIMPTRFPNGRLAGAVRWPAVAFLALLLLVNGGCGASRTGDGLLTVRGLTMGTVPYQVKLIPPPGTTLTPADWEWGIVERLEEINRLMSTYRDDSEVSRFNASSSTDWFEVSPLTAEVVGTSLEVSELSDGAFDITVGPLIDLWHFGRTDSEPLRSAPPATATPQRDTAAGAAAGAAPVTSDDAAAPGAPVAAVDSNSAERSAVARGDSAPDIPSEDDIRRVLEFVGYRRLEVRHDPPAIRKSDPRVQINLSAIAKGFAVDRVAEWLREQGVQHFLVEVGGEIRAGGERRRGQPWIVGIEAPLEDQRRLFTRLPLHDESLATSGDYRIFYEADGRRFSHTIDPRTGRPIPFALASVSVLTADCMHADALATALMVLGPDRGPKFAEEHSIAAYFIVRTDNGLRPFASKQFPVK